MIPALLALLILIVGVMFALSRHPGFRGRSIEEVGHFVLQVGEYLDDLERNFDPQRQLALKESLGSAYRGEMSRLVRSAREFLKRMKSNVGVLLEFAETERYEFNRARHAAIWSIAAAKAGHARLSRLERSQTEFSDIVEVERRERVHPQQLVVEEEHIRKESDHLAALDQRFEAIERFIAVGNRCYTSLWAPLLRASLWNVVPFAKFRFLPVPKLASFSNSKGLDVTKTYRETKDAALA